MISDVDITGIKILKFQSAYSSLLNLDEIAHWPELFVDNCVYRITTRDNYINDHPINVVYANSKNMLKDRVKSLQVANVFERQIYRHMIMFPRNIEITPKGVKAISNFIVCRTMREGGMMIYAAGEYIDEFHNDDENLLIKNRIVVCDSKNFDTLLAIPL